MTFKLPLCLADPPKRDDPLLIRFSTAERKALRRYAKHFNLTETDYIRRAAFLLGGMMDNEKPRASLLKAIELLAAEPQDALGVVRNALMGRQSG